MSRTPQPRPAEGMGDVVWAAACGLAAALFAAILSSVVFGRMPHVQDSIAQLFQARILAMGRLWAPSPALREFFDYPHMINDGRWYSQYPPGHSLLLVPGLWLGAPWLVNPLLGGLGVFATVLLARELFDRAIARAAGVLGVLSPFLILMASEFMSHVSAFCLLTFFLFFYFRMLRTRSLSDGIAAGACLGFAFLVRPYTAFAMAVPPALHAAWLLYKGRRELLRPALAAAAGGAAGLVLLALYNWGTTGDPFVPGYIRLYGPSHGLGFGKGTWGPPHTPARGLGAAWSTLVSLNTRLFEWPLTSLWPFLPALAPAPIGLREGLARRWLLAAVPFSLLAAHVFYWYHDLCFGPRYIYEALGPILALSGFGFVRTGRALARWLAPRSAASSRSGGRPALSVVPGLALGALLFAYAGAVGWPKLFATPEAARGAAPGSGVREGSYFQHFSREFWGVSPVLDELVRQQGLNHAIVFVRTAEHEVDYLPVRHLWFGSAFAWERPDPARAPVIFAQDRGAEDARLAALFPDRAVYLYTGTIEQGTITRLYPTR